MNHTQYKWWFPRLFEILFLCFFELCCSFIANWVLAKIGNSKWIRDFKATALRSKIFLKKCYFSHQEESKRSPMTVELIIEDIKALEDKGRYGTILPKIYIIDRIISSVLCILWLCVCVTVHSELSIVGFLTSRHQG